MPPIDIFRKSHQIPKGLLLLIIFSIFLLYFVFGSAWYEPSQLIIEGQSESDSPLIVVRWNSGAGYNDYEKRVFKPKKYSQIGKSETTLILGSVVKENTDSLSGDVVCSDVIVDGKHIDTRLLTTQLRFSDEGLVFSPGDFLTLPIKATSQISLRFKTTNRSGTVSITVNGIETQYDLYMPNVEAKSRQFDYWLLGSDGTFRVEMDMPRYSIDELTIGTQSKDGSIAKLNSAVIQGKGHLINLLEGAPSASQTMHFANVLESMRSYFSPLQFTQQIVFALITTWLLSALFSLYKKIGSIRACFGEERRQVFWVMMVCSLFFFGLWLAAFWPGVMSIDSLKIWRAAMLPNVYLNDHPVLNVFLYKYIYQLFGSPAAIAVVQIILMALLVSWFFFWLYRQGVSMMILLPCFLFILSAVPVGCYNIMLWKDVPFALLVVFWACVLVRLYRERRLRTLRWTKQKVVVLLLLAFALGLIRHNGVIYLVLLPILFLVLRLVPLRNAMIMLLFLVAIGALGITALKYTNKMQALVFVSQQVQNYAKGIHIDSISKDTKRVTEDYLKILDYDKTLQQWDKFHYYLKDRYAYWFLLHSGWWDVYPYKKEIVKFPLLRQKFKMVYMKSYQKPWGLFSWNPVWLLALLPVLTLLFWWFPHTSILGLVLLGGALPLVYLRIFNWRYYYFLYMGLLFIVPLMGLDFTHRRVSQVVE